MRERKKVFIVTGFRCKPSQCQTDFCIGPKTGNIRRKNSLLIAKECDFYILCRVDGRDCHHIFAKKCMHLLLYLVEFIQYINFTRIFLSQAIACAVDFDDQHCGIYAGDADSYEDFKEVFEPLILEYHGLASDFKHTSDMDVGKITGNIDPEAPVKSTRIRVGRSIDGFGLSPGITKQQRLDVENLMKSAFGKLEGDLSGNYFPLLGMEEATRQKLVDDHFLFMSGDKNLIAAGMERDWPEGRGIYHNDEKSFLVWVNEEDQLRIISMQKGGDVKGVFDRLARGIKAVGDSVKGESGKEFLLHEKYGYLHSCPTNLGTGMRASVHIDLPGWTKEGLDTLKKRCEELNLQPRGTRGESGGQTGITYDISNKHRLGYSEVQLVQTMIDGVNTLYKEDLELQKKHGL